MCDTLLAPPASTQANVMLFGKNSDRQRNEAEIVERLARVEHAPGAMLKCTYIAIHQARRTHAVLLCRPYWMWGAEMGANEHGVVIGNEGLQARSPPPQSEALTGMDLVRLGLERACTASEAVQVIVGLLSQYGQGGNGGHLTPAYYNNGFMIADSREAFVLETLGREWLVERVQSVRAYSNRYSIGRHPDAVSAGLPALIRDSGWSDEAAPHYAEAIASPNREHIGNAGARRACGIALLSARDGGLNAADIMGILRDHGDGDRRHAEWRAECLQKYTLCMHAGGEDRAGQTVGSLVSELHPAQAVHWVTGSAAPCTSIFKPVLLDALLPSQGPAPTDRSDPQALWWRHERLHRKALAGNFSKFLDDIRAEREELEADFRVRVAAVLGSNDAAARAQTVAHCWREAIAAEERWYTRLDVAAGFEDTPHGAGWNRMNRLAGLDPFTREFHP